VKAIYEIGTLRLPGPLPLHEKAQVTVTIRSHEEATADGERAAWLKVSEHALANTWGNSDDVVLNELLQE
jgi:hypothetical protein